MQTTNYKDMYEEDEVASLTYKKGHKIEYENRKIKKK
jgi:hypothetical protein